MNEISDNVTCFSRAMALFDAANGEDPNQDEGQPKELLYSQRMSEMLHRYAPAADEVVQLAVRAQHIRRWSVPRSDYPMTKEGYFQWRTGLYRMHAEIAGDLMAQAGSSLSGRQLFLVQQIIEHIEPTGYVGEDLMAAAHRLGVPMAEMEAALSELQRFDPTGVGARNLSECLAIQAREADRYDPCMAKLIDNLDLVAKGAFDQLKRQIIPHSAVKQKTFAGACGVKAIEVWDGATLVMGGLTREEVKKVNDKIPFFGDIPLVGRLFRSKGESSQKRNLLIFVTANLLEGDALKVSRYELVFHVSEYYKRIGVAQTNPEFLDVVPLRVAIWDNKQRYHVPLYFSPWGYMTYRGS